MHILLTRQQSESESTAVALEALGHRVSIVPTLEIQPVDESARQQRIVEILETGRPDSIICVSKNAVLWGVPQLLQQWPDAVIEAQWFALGSGTARALELFGVIAIAPKQARSEDFLDVEELKDIAGQKTLYLAGEGGRQLIESELGSRGAMVMRCDVYRRRPDLAASELLSQMNGIPDVLTAMSGESLLALDQALPENCRDKWASKLLLVPSERVAELAASRGFHRVQVVTVREKDWPITYLQTQADL